MVGNWERGTGLGAKDWMTLKDIVFFFSHCDAALSELLTNGTLAVYV